VGRALRAVADDHEAALSIGIPLKTIWVVVWSVAGMVALAGAGSCGALRAACSSGLSLIALKSLARSHPGRLHRSVPGAISSRASSSASERSWRVYWGPLVGGAIENWFAYVLALTFFFFAPASLRQKNH